MVRGAEGRRAHELRALEPVAQVVERQEQVLRAGLGEGLRAAIARVADRLQRVARREVDDVHRHLRRLGQADDAVRRLALEHRIAGDAVVEGIGLAVGHEVGGHDVDGQPVLRMHHDQPAVLGGLLHRPEDRAVVAVEHAGIGGEQLEVGDALRDQLVHLGQGRVVDVRHDHVEAVVDDGVALGLRMPRIQAGAERCPARLDGEVDDRRRPAERRGPRPRLERVLREGAAERQLHVGVHVDRARDDPGAGGGDRLVGGDARTRQVAPDVRDRLAVDQDVRVVGAIGRDDGAAADQGAHHPSTKLRARPGPCRA